MEDTYKNISKYEFLDNSDNSSITSVNHFSDFNINALRDKLDPTKENITYHFKEGFVILSFGDNNIIRITNIFIHNEFRCLGLFTIIETVLSYYFNRIEIISVQTRRFAKHLYSIGYKPLFVGSVSFYKIYQNQI